MTENKEKKNILIGGLLVAIIAMAVGYAALAQQLTINGTATVSSTWDVHFKTGTGTVTTGNEGGKTATVTAPAAEITGNTQATFAVQFQTPGDFAEYTFVVENTGSLDAVLDSITVNALENDGQTGTSLTETNGINYEVTVDGVDYASVNKPTLDNTTGTSTVKVKVYWDKNATTIPTKNVKKLAVTLDYVQA